MLKAFGETSNIAGHIVFQCRWAMVTPFLGVLLSIVVGCFTGSWNVFTIFFGLFLHCTAGLIGSYAIHEAAHAFVLKLCPGITGIRTENSLLRFSLVPVGTVTVYQALVAAASGPAICTSVGIILYFIPPLSQFCWWYLGHAVFLLPPFGDGRTAIYCLIQLSKDTASNRIQTPSILSQPDVDFRRHHEE